MAMFKNKRMVSIILLVVMFLNILPYQLVLAENNGGIVYEDDNKEIVINYDGDSSRVVIPDSVRVIKRGAFKNKNLDSLILGKNIEIIEDEAFSNNQISGEIKIPNSVKHIGIRAFSDNKIESLDLSNISPELVLGSAAFQDNEIAGELDLSKFSGLLPKDVFLSNKIEDIILGEDISKIEEGAFGANLLSEVRILNGTDVDDEAFHGNGQFVILYSENPYVKSSLSKISDYGHIVNPVNIVIRSLEMELDAAGNPTGRYKKLLTDKRVNFDPLNPDNLFSLNNKSYYKPDKLTHYEVANENMEDDLIIFTPNNKEYYIDVIYKKAEKPSISINKKALENLVSVTKEGMDIDTETLLSLIIAEDSKGNDISKRVKVSPSRIQNAESGIYKVSYTVIDDNGMLGSLDVEIPVAIDPNNIPIGDTEWVLGDFVYESNGTNAVTGLSEQGKKKAQVTPGIAIPHINPSNMSPIDNIGFKGDLSEYITPGDIYIGDPSSIKLISDNAFNEVSITGELPEMPNLEYIGSSSFKGTKITGNLDGMPKLKSIGFGAFQGSTIDGYIGDMPSLETIDSNAFSGSKISGPLKGLSKVKYIGSNAFIGSNLSGELPEMPNVEAIDMYAFKGTKIEGELKGLQKLKAIGGGAFERSNISGELPDLPEVLTIGTNAFTGTNISGQLPEMPKVEKIDQLAFSETQLNSTIPYMPNLKYIGYGVFSGSNFYGELPEFPSLEYIGSTGFYSANLTGQLPNFPNLKRMDGWAFNAVTGLTGPIPEMPKLEYLGGSNFSGTGVGGELPEMPNLTAIEDSAFYGMTIDTSKPFIIHNNNIVINENAFSGINNTEDYPVVLLTHDKGVAPNVEDSQYHILNPVSVDFVGKDENGKIIAKETIIGKEVSGGLIEFEIPRQVGYDTPAKITIKPEDMVNGSFEYNYQPVDKNKKNDYNFTFESDQADKYHKGEDIINTSVKFDTINKDVIKKGIVDIGFNPYIYHDFFIPSMRGVKEIDRSREDEGVISIILEDNLPEGTEMDIPVSFKIKDGVIPETLFPVAAELHDMENVGNTVKGYKELYFGAIYKDPVYKSEFVDNTDKDDVYRALKTVEDLNKDYDVIVDIVPKVDTFIRNFDKVVYEYDEVEFINKFGKTDKAYIAESNGWVFKDGKYVYELTEDIPSDLADAEIPPLRLKFDNPQTTEKFINIQSKVKADVNTKIDDFKYTEMEYSNDLYIHVAEPGEYSFGKLIHVPHYEHPKYSFFYDNLRERNFEFKWRLDYSTHYDVDKLKLTDFNLDERMKYTSIDPNGHDITAYLFDKDDKELIRVDIKSDEIYEIEESIQEDVKKVVIEHDGKGKPVDVLMYVGSKLKNPDIKHFNEEDQDRNNFLNYLKADVDLSNGKTQNMEDFAQTTIKPDNKFLKTEVDINTKTENLTYGKTANTDFTLKSKEFVSLDANNLKYSILINKGQNVENVVIPKNLQATYEIIRNYNDTGMTRIDIIYPEIAIDIENHKDDMLLASVKTTPADKTVKDLIAHGFLHPSENDDYFIYGQGKDVIAGIDSKEYSYDIDKQGLIFGSYFTVFKKIVKGDYVGTKVKTEPGEKFFYRIEIDNSTTTPRSNFELIDILPYEGDNNKSEIRNRLDVEAAKNIELPESFEIKFLNTDSDIKVANRNILRELSGANWSNEPAENTKAIKVFSNNIPIGGNVINIDIPMITNEGLEITNDGKETHNVFAYHHNLMEDEQTLSNPVTQELEIDIPYIDIKLRKISHFKGEFDGVIEGVRFDLLTKDGAFISSARTDKNGELIFKEIRGGDYIVREASTIPGYQGVADDIEISLKDMIRERNDLLDLGDVVNNRNEKYRINMQNVELIDDNLESLDYKDVVSKHTKGIKGATYILRDDKGNHIDYIYTNDRQTNLLELEVGKYQITQYEAAYDNGLSYLLNNKTYNFEIDKFGNLKVEGLDMNKRTVYLPNTVHFRESTVLINKIDQDGQAVKDAEFTLVNELTNERRVANTGSDGKLRFGNVTPGVYRLYESNAPKGYIGTDETHIIEVPISEEKVFEYEFINKKIKLNIHKYKIIERNLTEEDADDLINSLKSTTGGRFIKKQTGGLYQVREVWEDNIIEIQNGGKTTEYTDINGSVISAEESMSGPLLEDDELVISNKTKIPGHYEPDYVDVSISDYVSNTDFDGVIDIDIEVKPLKGTIYVSKYLLDKEEENKGSNVDGTEYTLYVDKGNGFEELDKEVIKNGSYLVFDNLDPLLEYKVVETYVPEGQEDSVVKEQYVSLTADNRFVKTVVFRNTLEVADGGFIIHKIDGKTGKGIEGVEFKISDINGDSFIRTTDENGFIFIDGLDLSLANYKVEEIKAADGYRLISEVIEVTEDDLMDNKEFVVKNYKYNDTPDTGTLGKLPYMFAGSILVLLAYVLRKKKEN